MLIANTSLRINESACREFSKLPKKKRSHTTAQITGSFCSVMFHSLSSTKWEGLTQKNSFLSQHFLAHFCTDTSKISIGSRKKKKSCIWPNQLKNNTEGSGYTTGIWTRKITIHCFPVWETEDSWKIALCICLLILSDTCMI